MDAPVIRKIISCFREKQILTTTDVSEIVNLILSLPDSARGKQEVWGPRRLEYSVSKVYTKPGRKNVKIVFSISPAELFGRVMAFGVTCTQNMPPEDGYRLGEYYLTEVIKTVATWYFTPILFSTSHRIKLDPTQFFENNKTFYNGDMSPIQSYLWLCLVALKHLSIEEQQLYLFQAGIRKSHMVVLGWPKNVILPSEHAYAALGPGGNQIRVLYSLLDYGSTLFPRATQIRLGLQPDKYMLRGQAVLYLPDWVNIQGEWISRWDFLERLKQKKYVKCNKGLHLVETEAKNFCFKCMRISKKSLEVLEYSADVLQFTKIHIKKTTSSPQFKRMANPTLMGLELEYDSTARDHSSARKYFLSHLNKFVIFKRDGSVTNGFEMVTAPAPIEIHKEKFEHVFDKFPKILQSTTGTGMHIHVDRKALSPLTIARLSSFMNTYTNREFIEKIGQRNLTNYCNQDLKRAALGFTITQNMFSTHRYNALNLAKLATVEFRIFQTPITYPDFAKNLEFVSALVEYMRAGWTNWTPKETISYATFIQFLKDNNRSTKNYVRSPHLHLKTHLMKEGIW